jgi:catechol 2,3-dioxygenase-like lactoylglutathione lyase family enzyme
MTDPAFQITGHATVLYVKDLPAALAYYRDKLGFTGEFVWGDPPYYACLCRGDAAIHLNSSLPPAAVSVVCIFCKGVDALHDDLATRGASITRETTTHPYGMRDFIVTDPDGHQLIFGQGTSEH